MTKLVVTDNSEFEWHIRYNNDWTGDVIFQGEQNLHNTYIPTEIIDQLIAQRNHDQLVKVMQRADTKVTNEKVK